MVSRVLGGLVAAALVVAIPVAGAAVVAEPGDPAWRITRTVMPDYARVAERSTEQAHQAATGAAVGAKTAIVDGDLAEAQRQLDRLRALLPRVTGDEQSAGYRLHELLTADLRSAQTTTTRGVR